MDFELSARAQDYRGRVRDFIRSELAPIEDAYLREVAERAHDADWRRWTVSPAMAEAKRKARAAGLWNLFLPDPVLGAGLSHVEYATLAEEMGRNALAPDDTDDAYARGQKADEHRREQQPDPERPMAPGLYGPTRA